MLVLLTLLALAAPADAATVTRVVDGDEVRVGKRLVKLAGVEAPALGACHGAEAKRALAKLLPKGAAVRVRGGKVYRGSRLINAVMVRAGHARAAGRSLASQQRQAEAAKRGLWKACGATPPAPTPQDPIARARADIAGRVFIHLATTTFSSAESRLHFCSDGTFVEYVETYSDFGGSTYGTYRGRWQVIAAEYRGDTYAAARVKRLNEDGTEGSLDIVAANGLVTVNGKVDTVEASTVCA